MGTNYYLHQKPACGECGRPHDDRLHIGKSSMGWCFSLHVIPEMGINDLPDWERLWSQPGAWIVDEYGDRATVEQMYAHITCRGRGEDAWERKPAMYNSWDEFHYRNQSEKGPNGLLRHRLGSHCVKHGDGTWDCITGEFS